jgi:hypothetical protein
MNIRILVRAAISFAVAAAPACHADDLAALKAQLVEAQAAVRSHTVAYEPRLDGTQAAQDALEREWSLIEAIVAAEFDANMDVTKQPIADGVSVEAIPLAGETWLVESEDEGLGTVFVARQAAGGFMSIWNIRQLSTQQIAAFPLLSAWSAAGATEPCTDTDVPCGPIGGAIGSLGNDDSGRVHFYLNGYYSGQQGEDLGYQLSVWVWDGTAAVPELAREYGQTMEVPVDISFKAPFLRLYEKNYFQTFYVNAPEAGRQMIWTILMTGNGVSDQGQKSLVPELDAVDELFMRLLKHQPTESVASPKVAAFVGDALRTADLYVDSADPDNLYGALGELWQSNVTHTAKGAVLCFSVDNLDNLAFTLERKDGGYFITRVRRVTEHDGGKSGCRYLKM